MFLYVRGMLMVIMNSQRGALNVRVYKTISFDFVPKMTMSRTNKDIRWLSYEVKRMDYSHHLQIQKCI